MTTSYGLLSPMQRARLRRLTREERAALASERDADLRSLAAARVLELMLVEGPSANAIRALNARKLLGLWRDDSYLTRDLVAR